MALSPPSRSSSWAVGIGQQLVAAHAERARARAWGEEGGGRSEGPVQVPSRRAAPAGPGAAAARLGLVGRGKFRRVDQARLAGRDLRGRTCARLTTSRRGTPAFLAGGDQRWPASTAAREVRCADHGVVSRGSIGASAPSRVRLSACQAVRPRLGWQRLSMLARDASHGVAASGSSSLAIRERTRPVIPRMAMWLMEELLVETEKKAVAQVACARPKPLMGAAA